MPLLFDVARAHVPLRGMLACWPGAMRAFGITLFAISLPGWTAAIAQPLTLQEALRVAQERSYALVAQDAAAQSDREMAVAAGRLPDPELRLSVTNLPVDGPQQFKLNDDFMTMRSIGLMQTFTREDKRRARAARFEREADAAQATRTVQLANLRRNTAIAWFDRYYQQQMVELLSLQRAESALQIEAAEAAYRADRGSQADVFIARSAVGRIDDRIREAQAQLANSMTLLARWVGDLATASLGDAPAISMTRLAAHSVEHQLDLHPGIALLTSKEAVARAEADIARQEKRADWSVELLYSQRGPAYSNMISLNLNVPLQWDQKNRQDRELAARLAKAEQARTEREEMTREHLADTQRWLTTWRSNLDRLSDYDKTLIPLAVERTRAGLAAYRGGRETLATVLEARRIEIDTRIERLRIEMETARLWAELEYLIPIEDEMGAFSAGSQSLMTNALER